MIMPVENITNADIAAAKQWSEAMKWSKLDAFNATLKFADHCVKRDLVPTTALKEFEDRHIKTIKVTKTNINDLLAAVNLIKHFGSAKAYDAEVDKYNNDDANVRVVYSHQTFQRKWLPAKKSNKAAPKKAPSLSAAVAAGVITKQQAAALRKMGF